MALSMTGCGDAVVSDGASTCRVEVRCVNNRFLKFSLRSREGFAALEAQIEAPAASCGGGGAQASRG